MKEQEKEFTSLYNQYAEGIGKLCLGYTGDTALAQDLLQETFLRAWNAMARFRGDAKWSTWIYRIAVNTCLTHLRKKKLSFAEIDAEMIAIAEDGQQKEQEVKVLYKCISRLAETDRLIISLVLEDKPYDEIADITGITENNLRVKIHRIKKQLSEIYNSYERL